MTDIRRTGRESSRRRIVASAVGFCGLEILCGLALVGCDGTLPNQSLQYQPGDELLGGDTTVFDHGRNAFSLSARNLHGRRRDAFFVGNSLFNRNWVTAPSSTEGMDGLGPTFNASSCSSCHFKDGRGAPPQAEGEAFLGLLVRLSIPGIDEHGGPLGEPNYGGQFNHRSILHVPKEGDSQVSYQEVVTELADGTRYRLRKPSYQFSDLQYGPMHPDTMLSPRVAPGMAGLGLLQAIDERTLLGLSDEHDEDGNGISGRPNRVWDAKLGRVTLGRFGWKANQPSLEQQNSGAFLGDMGITSPLFPEENCPPLQRACRDAQTGGAPEIGQDKIDNVTYYAHLLAVPAQRDFTDPQVLEGKGLFMSIGCADCHIAEMQTGELEGFPELSGQTIRPYTDLLLHDMGEELSDDRADFAATGKEWRTAPLWGIGLIPAVNRHTNLLHDGRARDLTEAILWHGGEAQVSRDAFASLSAEERATVVRFLESL
jgi:CxxC motif-containing protein (DUF1111 family)